MWFKLFCPLKMQFTQFPDGFCPFSFGSQNSADRKLAVSILTKTVGLFNCGLVFLTALLYYFAEETPFSQMYSLLMSDLPALSTSKLSSWTDHRKV